MSVRVMSWVWEHSRAVATQRFVLLAIADCANDAGAEAYPSMATLVKKTKLSERTVQDAVKKLVALGELVVSLNAGPRGCNKYRIVMAATPAASAPPQNLPPAESAIPPQDLHPTPAAPAPSPPQQLHPNHPLTILEPSLEPSLPPKRPPKRGTRIPDDFAVTPEMVAWARQRVPNVDGRTETEKFINYWTAKTGKDATKLNWTATWRNWMLTAADRRPRASPADNGQREYNGMVLNERTIANLERERRLTALDAQQLVLEGPLR